MGRKVTVTDTLDMSVAERMQLAQDIWDSIASEPAAVPMSVAEREEIERRVEERTSNPGPTIPWEQVKRQVMGGQ
jgi:putative addiction module component (TIGR02574 family)